MKKLFLILTLFVALAVPVSASAIGYTHSLMKLPSGANCLQSTSPPCQQVSFWPGILRVDNAIGLSGFDCNNGVGCYWYPGGVQFGQFNYNACSCNPGLPNRVGNISVYARQLCPNGVGSKYSATKTMSVNYAVTPFYWFGTLQILDQGGCQPR
jgi:hypothetical protein